MLSCINVHIYSGYKVCTPLLTDLQCKKGSRINYFRVLKFYCDLSPVSSNEKTLKSCKRRNRNEKFSTSGPNVLVCVLLLGQIATTTYADHTTSQEVVWSALEIVECVTV